MSTNASTTTPITPPSTAPSKILHHPTKEIVQPKTSGAIDRIKNAPKDYIPISRTPKRQRSSRFHITENIELEKLPNLKGK